MSSLGAAESIHLFLPCAALLLTSSPIRHGMKLGYRQAMDQRADLASPSASFKPESTLLTWMDGLQLCRAGYRQAPRFATEQRAIDRPPFILGLCWDNPSTKHCGFDWDSHRFTAAPRPGPIFTADPRHDLVVRLRSFPFVSFEHVEPIDARTQAECSSVYRSISP
jgi:hypothetical protein